MSSKPTKKKTKKKPSETINSLEEFLQVEFQRKKNTESIVVYRGHADKSYKIKPSIFRSPALEQSEDKIISEMLTLSPSDFSQDTSAFERLVRAQHHGLPSRLLDVTLNPLVALYFACYGSKEEEKDGQVLRFNASSERSKFFDSDTVSIVSNLSRLKHNEKEEISKALQTYKNEKGRVRERRERFNKTDAVERLCQFVRSEKPYFNSDINPVDLRRYFLAHPRKTNPRIIAQSGAFIITGMFKIMGDTSSEKFPIDRINIPHKSKKSILKDLDRLNINSSTLFPEIEKFAEYIKEKYS